MNTPRRAVAVLLLAAPALLAPAMAQPAAAQPTTPPPAPVVPSPWPYPQKLAMVQRNVFSGVEGRLDRMAFDPSTGVLYLAAPRNGSLEVHHVPTSAQRQSIPDLPEPTGVAFLASSRRVAVSCGGVVILFKAAADGRLTEERSVEFTGSADTLREDPATGRVYVAHADAIGSFNPATGEKGPDVTVGGVPEAFVLDGPRLYVNVPSKRAVVVVDREKNAVVAEWSLMTRAGKAPSDAPTPVTTPGAAPGPQVDGAILNLVDANYPMALDAANKRLFVATREPARLIVINTETGAHAAHVTGICTDADDCWYDAATRRVFITGGGGTGAVTAIAQDSADAYRVEFTTTTASGARTSLLVPEQRRLYVAAPRLGDEQAYLFVYLIGPR